MAGQNTVPLEGIDSQLNRVPMSAIGKLPLTWYMRLFTSQTATTVPSDDATLTGGGGGVPAGTSPVVEAAGGAYAAVAMAGAGGMLLSGNQWGAPATIAAKGRKTTALQQQFPQSSGSWGNINGFFIASSSASTGAINVAAPAGLTATLATAAPALTSSFPGGTAFFYKCTILTASGETAGSNEPGSVSPSASQCVQLACTAGGAGTIGYRWYRSTTTGTETTSPALIGETYQPSFVDTNINNVTGATGVTVGAVPAATSAQSGIVLYYANFSDGLTVAINGAGYTLQVTPFFELDSSQ